MTALYSTVLQPGAVIQSAERFRETDAIWVRIITDQGTIYFAGARMAIELECPKCGECRLVEVIETAKKKVGACKVCAHSFPLKDHEPSSGR